MQHTILLTLIPRGIAVNAKKLPVSIVVSPRLSGGKTLGLFPDWLFWAERIKENGLTFVLHCKNKDFEVDVDTSVIRPDLWAAIFNRETLVRPFAFQDFSDRGVYSYSVRQTLSALKETYQKAAVSLALPEDNLGNQREGGLRKELDSLLEGFAVNWNDRVAQNARKRFLHKNFQAQEFTHSATAFQVSDIGPDGLLKPGAVTNKQSLSEEFSNFHRMPQPEKYSRLKDEDPDFSDKLDFHQAISAIHNYPALQRAFGLVFDIDIPENLIAPTVAGGSFTLSVKAIQPNWDWKTVPQVPELKTAYWYLKEDGASYFMTAPEKNNSLDGLGLLNLDPANYGLAQIDVDGGMHKLIRQAESFGGDNPPETGIHQSEFDNTATLSTLRSGGLSLFADRRALRLLAKLSKSKALETALNAAGNNPTATPTLFSQDLVKGYRLDIWDDQLKTWHSLHQRNESYTFGEAGDELVFEALNQEGYVQLAATSSAVEGASNAFYLHESVARWAGWSLSAPLPGLALSSDPDPANALTPEEQNPMVTPFKMRPTFRVVPGTLPALRFGRKYNLRARIVDLAGNSLLVGDVLARQLAEIFGLPRTGSHFPYLRYEPVDAPIVLVRDTEAITGPGSELMRMVIRSFNDDISKDDIAPDLKANDRLILPPRTSVEMAERLGMLDDAGGKLRTDAALYNLLATRDGAELTTVNVVVAGESKDIPIETQTEMPGVPYLPDVLARGAALRNAPGGAEGSVGRVEPGAGGDNPVPYDLIPGANPRKGSATLVSFGNESSWEDALPFRLALEEGDGAPHWDASRRLLTIYLPKGNVKVSILSSYLLPTDLEKMGMWQWLREYIDYNTRFQPEERTLDLGVNLDRIEHILQRVVEGGHWMLTPPHLITFVHAVQQPVGVPSFVQTLVQRDNGPRLQTIKEDQYGPVHGSETFILSAWRKPDATDLLLLGGLSLHLPSSAKVDLYAEWTDPVDDPTQNAPTEVHRSGTVDEIPFPELREGYLESASTDYRSVGYLLPEDGLIVWGKQGDGLGSYHDDGIELYQDAAPRHNIRDTLHHVISYRAVSTSRFREYFDKTLDFTRSSAPITVHVPASARPAAPNILYVLPTFGWQRQMDTDVKRSVRFGGGLRIYLDRPWYSSGEGELLGVLHHYIDTNNETAIEQWKPFITQWGGDPIWNAYNPLSYFPGGSNFRDAVATDYALSLEENTPREDGHKGKVDVSGYAPVFDPERKLWYCDITIDAGTAYMPFVRLALARYQPYALQDAKLSRAVTADFIQTLPNRSLVVMPDTYKTGLTRFTLSGVAPDGPLPHGSKRVKKQLTFPVDLQVRLQILNPDIPGELAWQDATPVEGQVTVDAPVHAPGQPEVKIWTGNVQMHQTAAETRYRLLFEEREYHSGDVVEVEKGVWEYPSRVVYVEAVELV